MCTTPCAAPCRPAFQTAQNELLGQMHRFDFTAKPYGGYIALQRQLRDLEDAYTAALATHDPEGFAANEAEDERQAAYHADEASNR